MPSFCKSQPGNRCPKTTTPLRRQRKGRRQRHQRPSRPHESRRFPLGLAKVLPLNPKLPMKPHGCGSKLCRQNGALVNGNVDWNMRYSIGLIFDPYMILSIAPCSPQGSRRSNWRTHLRRAGPNRALHVALWARRQILSRELEVELSLGVGLRARNPALPVGPAEFRALRWGMSNALA